MNIYIISATQMKRNAIKKKEKRKDRNKGDDISGVCIVSGMTGILDHHLKTKRSSDLQN